MAELSNVEIIQRIQQRLAEKDEVIREQQKQIHELENNVQELERKLVEAEEKLVSVTGAAEDREAVLAERARIARDIHDILAHSLSAQIVHLEGARLLLRADRSDEALERVEATVEAAGEAGVT